MPPIPLWMPILYIIIGVALAYNLFLSRIGSPDALFQAYDVTQHLDIIQSMSESGRFTSLGVNPYMSPTDTVIAPIDYSGFYPAAWHALCALTIMLSGVQTTVSINASMFVMCAVSFPLAVLAFVSAVFPNSKKSQLIGAVICLAFVSFPWNLLAFGPVYPNVAGYCLLPSAMALFINLLSVGYDVPDRIRFGSALLIAIIGLALCHPSAIFTCVVILSPYCVHRICDACNMMGAKSTVKVGLSTAFALFVISFWVTCYKLPAFHDTVSHIWNPYAWTWQEVMNILLLSHTFGFYTETAAQYLLAVLVVFGFSKCFFTRGKRWMCASYIIACCILVIAATRSDELKQLVAGFWYTDPMRLASVCVIATIPLAILGMKWLYGTLVQLLERYNAPLERPTHARALGCGLAAMFLVINFMPSFNLPGAHRTYTAEEYQKYGKLEDRDRPIKSLNTTFGDYRQIVSDIYAYNEPLDSTERVFLSKVQDLVDKDGLIINDPMDGSFLAYGVYGMRMYYRNFTGFGGNGETAASQTLRLHLCEYASNDAVKSAVEETDARYVLIMRGNENESSFINLRGDFDQSLFTGITSINEETEGFKLLLKTGPMALYEIER